MERVLVPDISRTIHGSLTAFPCGRARIAAGRRDRGQQQERKDVQRFHFPNQLMLNKDTFFRRDSTIRATSFRRRRPQPPPGCVSAVSSAQKSRPIGAIRIRRQRRTIREEDIPDPTIEIGKNIVFLFPRKKIIRIRCSYPSSSRSITWRLTWPNAWTACLPSGSPTSSCCWWTTAAATPRLQSATAMPTATTASGSSANPTAGSVRPAMSASKRPGVVTCSSSIPTTGWTRISCRNSWRAAWTTARCPSRDLFSTARRPGTGS